MTSGSCGDRPSSPDPRLTTFPRPGKELTSYYRSYTPYFDDIVQLKAAARLSSLKWAETSGEGVSKEVYLLAVADKAMEILEYTRERDWDKDVPEKRSEWRESLKVEVIPSAIAAAEKHQPLPIDRKDMVAFLMSVLNANYTSPIHAFEAAHKEDTKHDFMTVVSQIELPELKEPWVSGPTFQIMSPRVGNNIIKAREALEHLNPLYPGYSSSAADAPVPPATCPRDGLAPVGGEGSRP